MLGFTTKSPEFFLIPCLWFVSCLDVITPFHTFKMTRLSNGTFLCSLDRPSIQIPLQQQQQLSAGSKCVPATVGCAQQCTWDARCTNFNLRQDLNRCDLFYNQSTKCGIIPGCFHGQLNESSCNVAVCIAGFVYVANVSRCYRFLNETLNQTEAARRCGSLDPASRLVMISNPTQQNAVKAYLDSVLNPPATSVCASRNTVWTSGVPDPNLPSSSFPYRWNPGTNIYYPTNYTNYYAGEPNGGAEGPYCIALWQQSRSQWNDEICALKSCALCEYAP